MTFAAVTKNIKCMYSNNDFEMLFIRYKVEAMPQKSMVQGYKTSNSTGTSRRTTGNGGQFPKGSVLYSYSGKKEEYGPLSCKNDVDIRMTNGIRIQQRNLTYRNLKRLIEKLEGPC